MYGWMGWHLTFLAPLIECVNFFFSLEIRYLWSCNKFYVGTSVCSGRSVHGLQVQEFRQR